MNRDRVGSFLRRLVRLVPIALVLSGITGCTANGFVVTGKVIDGETGKPIPNAWVHQEWIVSDRIAYNWNGSTTRRCADEQVTKTDAKGKFRFEKPPRLHSSVIWESTGAYLTPLIPGYELDYDKSKDGGESHQVVVVRVSPEQRSVWLHKLQIYLLFTPCPPTGANSVIAKEEILRSIAAMKVSPAEFAAALGYVSHGMVRPTSNDPAISRRWDLYEQYLRVVGDEK
ncbi:MAG: carboxypeptidase-like regulatory domain-containing protein [Burkholderiales bacterium]|nr:carboxypeptidase-like regulatory domain-containing protein [Burkholderiales bacterium]